MSIELAVLRPGDALPARGFGPITRATLALYAGGSGDYNPMHIDSDFARRAGSPDVFAHSMLSMAYLAQYLRGLAPQDKLRSWNVRFTAITPVNAKVTCSASVVTIDDNRREATLALSARIDDGTETVSGGAVISF